jgi:N-glycosylase/DNA lyase
MNELGFFGTIMYNGSEMVDIFHNYNRFFKNIETNYTVKEMSIKDSPRPELLSYQLYGTTEYYWVLLLINDIYDPYYDWIMSDQSVHEYAAQKYKNVGGSNEVAYYISSQGEKFWNVYEAEPQLWYDKRDLIQKYLQFHGALVPVTNIEHEFIENEKKRVVRIIQPNDITSFINDFRIQMEKSRNERNK